MQEPLLHLLQVFPRKHLLYVTEGLELILFPLKEVKIKINLPKSLQAHPLSKN